MKMYTRPYYVSNATDCVNLVEAQPNKNLCMAWNHTKWAGDWIEFEVKEKKKMWTRAYKTNGSMVMLHCLVPQETKEYNLYSENKWVSEWTEIEIEI